MPEAGQRPDDQDVQNLARMPFAVAAQRDVDIIAEPGSQRHVPAPPEFRDTGGNIGVVEVFKEIKAEDPAQPDRHVAVARKVEVDLKGEGGGIEPVKEHGFFIGGTEYSAEFPELVGKEDFFGKAEDKAADTGGSGRN